MTNEVRTRRKARARAVQAVYAWDVLGEEGLERVAARLWDDIVVGGDVRRRALEIVRLVDARGGEIDGALRDVTTNWRLERLGASERSVLRVAGAELLEGTTPPKVVIQEAVRLAERFGSEPSARFVNGVVDALARRMGRLS
ncbi:MAG TPA: transcription antitermination factor NusB [Gemmatimonadaceae bacterium]|nr:transcription antitermination factor NusB [Gemmatimonadaceae bacterium]